jgi:hypothetical protein
LLSAIEPDRTVRNVARVVPRIADLHMMPCILGPAPGIAFRS